MHFTYLNKSIKKYVVPFSGLPWQWPLLVLSCCFLSWDTSASYPHTATKKKLKKKKKLIKAYQVNLALHKDIIKAKARVRAYTIILWRGNCISFEGLSVTSFKLLGIHSKWYWARSVKIVMKIGTQLITEAKVRGRILCEGLTVFQK